MKFYYNGKLVRTSKKHEYKYGLLLWNGEIRACSSNKESLYSEIARIKKVSYLDIEYMKSRNYPADEIAARKDEIETNLAALKIVELEAKA